MTNSSSSDSGTKTRTGRVVLGGIGGALSSALFLPALSHKARMQLRGALVFEVFARQGISLRDEARRTLAEGSEAHLAHSLFHNAVRVAAEVLAFRLTPVLTMLTPAKNAYETMVFTYLLDRYVSKHRSSSIFGPRSHVELDEALQLQSLIAQAAANSLSFTPVDGVQEHIAPLLQDDTRKPFDRIFDTAIGAVLSVPERIARRLNASFDELACKSLTPANASEKIDLETSSS